MGQSKESTERYRVIVLGAGQGGKAILEMFLEEPIVEVLAVVDIDPMAPAMALARRHGILTFTNLQQAVEACAPCIAFNATGDERVEQEAANVLGPGAVIGGLSAYLIWRMITQLQKTKDELLYQATHDPLTGLFNRRQMLWEIERGLQEAIRYDSPYSIALIDVDRFKNVNDTYGHDVGDLVLKHVAETLRKGMRKADQVGRWGGEEFLACLPLTNGLAAENAAKQWLRRVMDSPIQLDDGRKLKVGFSAGVATYHHQGPVAVSKVIDGLLALADRCLYQAKRTGRARVVSAALDWQDDRMDA